MSIDHSILNNLQPVKIEDPLARYANFLAMQSAMNKNEEFQNSLTSTAAFNAAMKKALRPDGTYDRGVARSTLIGDGFGSLVPVAEKGWVDLDKGVADVKKTNAEILQTKAAAAKARAETVAKKLEYFNSQWGGVRTVDDLLALNDAMYTDEDTGAFFTGVGGSREKGAAEIQRHAKAGTLAAYIEANQKKGLGLEKALKTNLMTVDNGGTNDLVQYNEYGSANPKVVKSFKVTESPKAARTTINVSTGDRVEGALGVALAQERGKDLNTSYKLAQEAPRLVREADRALDILESGKVFTGRFANVFNDSVAVMKAMGFSVGPEVTNTEQLKALLAKKTLAAIQSSGVGARGMDTPKEREFLEKAENGTITLDHDTLVTAANLMRKAANTSIERWNEEAATLPETAFRTGMKRKLPLIPERKSKAVSGLTEIDW